MTSLYTRPSMQRIDGMTRITTAVKMDKMKATVRESLERPLGIEILIQKTIQVEGAFGIIKKDMQFRRFTRTSFKTYNLKKYHNKKQRLIQQP